MTKTIISYNGNELKQLSNVELLLIVKNLNMTTKSMSKFIKNNHHNPVLDEVISRTNFLDETVLGFIPILARLYCLEHNLTSHPECQNPECDHKVEWRNGLHKFAPYCSMKCRDTDPGFQERKQQAMFERHGVKNCMELDWVKDKIKKTNLDRRGVEYATQAPEVKEKTKRTCLENHGVEFVLQLESVKKKGIETSIKNWGVEHPIQSKEIKQRVKQTFINNYGVAHPMQTDEVKARMRKTMMDLYNAEYSLQVDEIKQKVQDTMMDKYGVLWFPQSEEYHKKSHKPYTNPKYPNMTFGSSWEFIIYDFFLENRIDFEYQPEISLPYDYEGTHHTYHPDFKIGDKIVEVKGDNFFRVNEKTGKEEMFCPYRYKDWTDEKYDWMCGLYEAKHQCMLANKVIILRSDFIKIVNNI